MTPHRALLALVALAAIALAAPTAVTAAECELEPSTKCFGIETVEASLSNTEAGAHPDVTFTVDMIRDPNSPLNPAGEHDSYASPRNIRVDLPPGLIGNPNVLGVPQQCTQQELLDWNLEEGGGCPNGSQIGRVIATISNPSGTFAEPLYMMAPPGGEVVARLGFIAGIYPTVIDAKIRSEDDYGISSEVSEITPDARLLKAITTFWGVPAHPSHDRERCTPREVFFNCAESEPRPAGSRELPFWTNPTHCGVPLTIGATAMSWAEPDRPAGKSGTFPTISGCNRLPFGPNLTIEPTSRHAASPTGLDVTIRLPASEGVEVLEPAQMRDIKVALPKGLVTNPSVGDGLDVCSAAQVHFKERVASECPDAAKLADTEFDIAALSRRMKGAIYLREPEPGDPFRVWVVADDLGAHVKLPGRLNVDKSTGQIESILLDAPQAPLREVKLQFKSGFRAPLVNPSTCGTFLTHYEFVPWSGNPPLVGDTPMQIDKGCEDTGGFDPKLSAGTTNPTAGEHSPFLFTLTRQDGEQNVQGLDITLPRGFAATFAGIPRCDGAAAQSGACPPASRIGKVIAAVGAGHTPLWVPQPGKRPTAIYLAAPYKGAPLSIVAVVPRQAGPFDFGDEVVRTAITVDPVTGQATAHTDPLPQLIEGIPIGYRTIHVELDRPDFALNPTGCAQKSTQATVTSPQGAVAHPSSGFQAKNCALLDFKPKLSFRLLGATHRGAHPRLRATLKARPGDANIAGASVALPRSEFLDQAHIKTVCTRVQFAAKACPPGSIYGHATARTPLFDEVLSGPVYLRSSSNPLPDVVVALKGPDSLPIEVHLASRVDSINGGIRNTFEVVPDAPVSSFVLKLQGGDKGLLVNSTNLCAKDHRATAKFTAHNGRKTTLHPLMQASCGQKQKR